MTFQPRIELGQVNLPSAPGLVPRKADFAFLCLGIAGG